MKSLESIFEKVKSAISRNLNLVPARVKTDIDPNGLYDDGLAVYQTMGQALNTWLRRSAEDKQKYEDYSLMDNEIPEITSALDVIADFIIYPDCVNKTKSFEVKSKSSNKKIMEKIAMIDDITKFKREFWSIARETCKYGDDAEEVLRNKSKEVVSMKNIPVETFCVNMNNGIMDKSSPYKQVDDQGKVIANMQREDVLHFSIPSDRRRFALYGRGVSKLEKARLIYRQLRLMEEGMMISRLSASNQNYAIIMDVGDYDPIESIEYMEKYRKRLNRRKYIDPSTGRISMKWNPLSMVEDLIVPTRSGSNAGVVQLNKTGGSNNIDDVNYFQNKLIYAVGVPKLLIGKEEDVNSKSTSETQYISFLRMIRRIQKLLEDEIIHFYTVALESFGIKNPDLYVDWPLAGTIDEERKWRIEQLKVQIAASLSQDMSMVDDYWIYQNLMGMTDDEITELVGRMDEEERKYEKEIADKIDDAEEISPDSPEDPGDDPEPDSGKSTNGKRPTKRVSKKSGSEDDESESSLLKVIHDKLGDKKFTKFNDTINLVKSDPALTNSLYAFIRLTKIKAGDLS